MNSNHNRVKPLSFQSMAVRILCAMELGWNRDRTRPFFKGWVRFFILSEKSIEKDMDHVSLSFQRTGPWLETLKKKAWSTPFELPWRTAFCESSPGRKIRYQSLSIACGSLCDGTRVEPRPYSPLSLGKCGFLFDQNIGGRYDGKSSRSRKQKSP